MQVYIPSPGTSAFDEHVKKVSKRTGMDQTAVRLFYMTILEDAERERRLDRESEDRWRRGDIDI